MDCRPISPASLPHVSRLFAHFVEDFVRVAEFFAHPPSWAGVLAASRRAVRPPKLREEIAAILRAQNRSVGASEATLRNIDRLEQGALAVVTGQQATLFSGPAYSFYKVLGCIRVAAELTAAGVEAVPVFWLATEDHDLQEVSTCTWHTRHGLLRFELDFDVQVHGQQVGRVPLPEQVNELVKKATAELEGPSAPSVTRALERAYQPGRTLGAALAMLMADLLAGRGLIVLDPVDPRFHHLARSLYRRVLDQGVAIVEALLRRSERLVQHGYHAQARVLEDSTLLFINRQGRRLPLERRGRLFALGEELLEYREVVEVLEQNPEDVSGNVLLRPVVQDALLPTVAYIAGPAEVAYLAQAECLYQMLEVPMPAVLARPGFTLVEPPVRRILNRYRLTVEDVLQGRQQVRPLMEREALPGELSASFTEGERAVRGLLERLRSPLIHLDPTLAGALETAERKILYHFEKLRERAGRAWDLRVGILDRHERFLLDSLYPHHALQERVLCLLPFLARRGLQLLDELLACASVFPPRHVVGELDGTAGMGAAEEGEPGGPSTA
jgi:bacillithiol biosynthesis cysteine-adding enzyme BshC